MITAAGGSRQWRRVEPDSPEIQDVWRQRDEIEDARLAAVPTPVVGIKVLDLGTGRWAWWSTYTDPAEADVAAEALRADLGPDRVDRRDLIDGSWPGR